MFPIHVINLATADERLQQVTTSAQAAGLTLTRVDAIDGQAIAAGDRGDADTAGFEKRNGRKPSPDEFAQHLNHLNALDQFIASGQSFAVIAQDDIVFSPRFVERTQALIDQMGENFVLKLFNHHCIDFRPVGRSVLGDEFGRTWFGPQGSAACYALDRSAAIQLRKALGVFVLPWDVALERGWDHGVKVFSAHTNLVALTVTTGTAQAAPWRPAGVAFRCAEFARRALYAREQPALPSLERRSPQQQLEQARSGADAHSSQTWIEWSRSGFGVACMLIMLSAFWIESDAYRYAAVELILIGAVGVFVREVIPRVRWPLWLCVGWAAYALIRLTGQYVLTDAPKFGSAEGVYVLPLLYPAVGYAFFLLRHRWKLTSLLFALLSLSVLLGSTNYLGVINYVDVTWAMLEPLFFTNRIHGAVASTLLLMAGTAFAMEHRRVADGEYRAPLLALGLGVASLALVNVLSTGVRGAWFAAASGMVVLLVREVLLMPGRRAALVGAGFALLAIVVITVFDKALMFRIDPVLQAYQNWMNVARGNGESLLEALYTIAQIPGTATSVTSRLQLWLSAVEVWQTNPLFGTGIHWLVLKDSTTFGRNAMDAVHNGYLELLVRHGLIGFAFYCWLAVWSTHQFYQAARKKIITSHVANAALALLVTYLVSLLTNSNDRLSFGEAFTMLYCSTAFGLAFWLQHLRETETATGMKSD